MAINFPGSLDNFTNPTSSSPINSPSHADQHANANDAIEALEAKVGIDGSSVVTSHDYKIAQLQSLVTSAVAGAKSIYQDVRNQSGSAFTKATPVYVSGSTGASGQLLVSAASNATEATSSKTMGITTSAISNNSNGQVISEGILEGIDTTGAADGDPVWLGVNGAKIYGLANKPSAPAHLVFLGIVIRGGQANTGSMYVKIQNGFELQEIHNVEISSLINGNILTYDSTTQTWKNTNTIQSTSSTIPLVVKASTSQSVAMQQWQDSAGTIHSEIRNSGQFRNQAGAILGNRNGSTLGVLTLYNNNAAVIPLVVQAAASQTANLQEWQNSGGTSLVSVSATGQVNFQGSAYIDIYGQFVTPTTVYANGVQNNTGYWSFNNNGVGSITARSATYTPLTLKGAASQTADLQQWQNSAGTVNARIDAYGTFQNGTASGYGAWINVQPKLASDKGIIIRGAASQTANLQEWQNSSGTVLASIDANGQASFKSTTLTASSSEGSSLTLVAASGQTAPLLITSGGAQIPAGGNYFRAPGIEATYVMNVTSGNLGTIPFIVKGAASQTANLQEWQNSAGTALASVSATGTIYAYETANSDALNIYQGSGARRLVFGLGGLSTTSTFTSGSISWSGVAQTEINSGTASRVGLLVKGAASQTANLQEWQNSAGTILASVDSYGNMVSQALSTGITRVSFAGLYGASLNVIPYGTAQQGIIVRAVASQTADLQQWQDSAGTVLAYVAANGHLLTPRLNITNGGNIVDSAGTTPYFAFGSNQIAIYARNAAYKPLVIQGADSQSANLQEWQQSDGTVTSYVGGDGNIFVQNARALFVNSGYIGSASLVTKAAGPTWSGLIVKAATSQTANLQEWQDSSGNVLSKIDSSGAFKTASKASFGTISGGGVWGGYSPVVEIRNPSASTSAINIFAVGGPAIRVYDGSGYQRGAWNQDGSIVVGQSNTKLATLSVYADSATSVGTIIRGSASQTANLQEWQNSAGTAIATMSPGGNLDIALRLTAYNGVSAYNASTFGDPTNFGTYIYSNMVGISTGSAGNVGLVIKGVTSQSGDLQQWRDSSGNILTGISSNGLIYSGKSYSSYNIESAGTLASSESIANTFNLQGKNNLIYPSIITDVGGNGWTSVTPNYGTAPDGTQTSTRYVWNSSGNCFATASDSNPNTYVGEIYTVSAYIKINAGTGSVALRYSKADSSKNAGIQINLSTKTATAAFDASDYNVLSYSLISVGKNWYRAIATIKVLVNHTIERVMLAATGNVGDIEVWGFQLERGLSASPLTPTTNALVTTINTLNIPYGQINLQSNASTIGLIIKSANAQTANLTEWQTNTGATIAYVDSNGSAFLNSNLQVNGVAAVGTGPQAYSQFIIQTNSATRNGLVIKGASGQSANLQEWQNSSGTIMARITPSYIFEAYNGVYSYQLGSSNDGSLVANMGANGSITFAGTVSIPTIKSSTSSTISVNTATTVDTVALSSFTSMEYTLSIKQGSKIRSSKVLVHTDGTSVDSTEYGIMEMGGGITGILVTASVSSTNAILQVTITDAATTNATVKLIKTML